MEGNEINEYMSAEEDDSVEKSESANQQKENKINKPDNKRKKSITSPSMETTENKKSRIEISDQTKMMLYIKGSTENMATFAKKKPVAVKKAIEEELGSLDEVKITGEFIRIICKNQQQKSKGMQLKAVLDKSVSVSEPFVMTKENNKQENSNNYKQNESKGIIFGVPTDITDKEIKEEINATWIKRLLKREGENLSPTETVIFGLDSDSLPSHVYIGCVSKRVNTYIARPMRCGKCQIFGHRTHQCYAKEKCARCSGSHKYIDCPNINAPKCVNCKGEHSAGDHECPKYKEVQETLKIVATEKMSYANALKQVKEIKKFDINELAASEEAIGHGLAVVSLCTASSYNNNNKAAATSTGENATQTDVTECNDNNKGQTEISQGSDGSSKLNLRQKRFTEQSTQTENSENKEEENTPIALLKSEVREFSQTVLQLLKTLNAPIDKVAEIAKLANSIIRTRKNSK
jgi:hypothetical protein